MTTAATALRLWALDAPTLTIDAGDLVVGLEGPVTIPCPAFLIEHPDGWVMFDTSLAHGSFDDPVAEYGEELVNAIQIRTRPEQRLDRQLDGLGLATRDITHVVLSHGHPDHSGGLFLFPGAKFFVGPGELERYENPPPGVAHLYRREDYEPTRDFDWTQVSPEGTDIFGDGAVRIIPGPGHSPGQLMLLVTLPSQAILLTADAVHLQAGLDREVPDGVAWDDDASVRTLKLIKKFRDDEGAHVWIPHDPDHWASHRHAPEYYS
ncbi:MULTISPECIES: N-acyl homoserine lactonase family protein [unclassified Modestobacter]